MRVIVLAIAAAGVALAVTPGVSAPLETGVRAASAASSDLSAQSRRRARPRITVRRPGRAVGLSPPGYGTDADLSRWKRDCVAVFEPRFIPARGETVIYGSRRCHWVLE